jgi:hypothetical protein
MVLVSDTELSHNFIPKETEAHSIASAVRSGTTSAATTVGPKLYRSFAINTTKTSLWCGLVSIFKIHHNSNFGTRSSLMFLRKI